METILDKNTIDLVLYHGSCSDGFGSAFIVWYYYKKNFGLEKANSISYIPCYFLKEGQQLSNDYLNKMSGKNILMCDFSYKYDELIKLINVSTSFMILDHHKSAEGDLKNIPNNNKIFNMTKSGVGITWEFMFDQESLPKFLEHIQDRDIWTYKIPKTLEFCTFFNEQKFNFELWEEYLNDDKVNIAIETGTNWLEYQNIIVTNIIKKTSYIIQEINNQYYIVIYCNSSEFKSDVGNKVFDKIPLGDFSCVWDYNLYYKQANFSLRSTNDRMDVSLIAQKFGGGGHHNAAGATFTELIGHLPFPIIEDIGLFDLLMHNKKKGMIKLQDNDMSYTLFKVKEINEKWFEDKYMNLIKRKCKDSILIVFEVPSNSVNIQNDNIIPLKDYLVIYNEKSITVDPIKVLPFMVLGSDNTIIEFTSEKEFDTLFLNLDNKLDHPNDWSDEDSSQYFYEEIEDDQDDQDDKLNNEIA